MGLFENRARRRRSRRTAMFVRPRAYAYGAGVAHVGALIVPMEVTAHQQCMYSIVLALWEYSVRLRKYREFTPTPWRAMLWRAMQRGEPIRNSV